jgi:hypothetical protein
MEGIQRALCKELLHKTRYPTVTRRSPCSATPAYILQKDQQLYMRKRLVGVDSGVAIILPRVQYSWGYHMLYAAIHHPEQLEIIDVSPNEDI